MAQTRLNSRFDGRNGRADAGATIFGKSPMVRGLNNPASVPLRQSRGIALDGNSACIGRDSKASAFLACDSCLSVNQATHAFVDHQTNARGGKMPARGVMECWFRSARA